MTSLDSYVIFFLMRNLSAKRTYEFWGGGGFLCGGAGYGGIMRTFFIVAILFVDPDSGCGTILADFQ